MKFICVDQMLSGKSVPAYDEIIAKLKKAIEIVEKEPETISLNWLRRGKTKTSGHFGLFDWKSTNGKRNVWTETISNFSCTNLRCIVKNQETDNSKSIQTLNFKVYFLSFYLFLTYLLTNMVIIDIFIIHLCKFIIDASNLCRLFDVFVQCSKLMNARH